MGDSNNRRMVIDSDSKKMNMKFVIFFAIVNSVLPVPVLTIIAKVLDYFGVDQDISSSVFIYGLYIWVAVAFVWATWWSLLQVRNHRRQVNHKDRSDLA